MAVKEETQADRRSLEDVHASIDVPSAGGSWPRLRRLFTFLGPAYLVSVGYMDPGNWATDLEGGARFGYALLWVLLMSNLMAVLLQTLAARLGVVTGHDLAQACRAEYSPALNFVLWLLAEVAIAATDLAEVLGTIIGLKLLFGLPLLWGCVITAFDTFALLYLQRWGMRQMEALVLVLVGTIGACFLVQIVQAQPEVGGIVAGLRPSLPPGALFVAIGILGATVMPHNLYLHSALVQTRRIGTDPGSRRSACKYYLIDSAIALNAAFFVNSAILVLSAAVFHRHGVEVATIEEAHKLLPSFLGKAAPVLFAIALLCAGQSSTLTGTLSGQIVMEGYLHLRIAPWLRRLVTRLIALVPAVLVIGLTGEESTQQLLVLSQVILSLQLSFAVIPLIHFTSNRRNMGTFANPGWVKALAWASAAVIVSLNGKLVVDQALEWVELASQSGLRLGPIPLSWLVAAGLIGLIGAVGSLLAYVTFKPLIHPSLPWVPPSSISLDWDEALRPHKLARIGVALEHDPADAEILNRAIGLVQANGGHGELLLMHVVDTPVTRIHGAETADRETGGDAQYLTELAEALRQRGYSARPVLLYGPDAAGQLVGHLRTEPVDLLVVGSHGHGLVPDLLFGQTVDRVRHHLEIPMLIVRPGRGSAPPAATGLKPGDPVASSEEAGLAAREAMDLPEPGQRGD